MLRNATGQEQARQHIDDPIGRDAAIDFQGQALARVFVRDRKPLQWRAAARSIVDEVPRPNMVLVLRATTHATVAMMPQTPPFPSLFRHLKAFLSPKAIHPFVVDSPTFLPQLGADHPIAVARILPYQLVHPRQKSRLVRGSLLRLVSLRAPRLTKRLACPTLRHVPFSPNVPDCLATLRRAQ